ncbi:MAG: low molecular weight phosphotyrosine protein phosphatase [Selenomonadaceae bacterium]|nr:low molecular weight phosphotyrosine protein phosphatase [Selenomonadaceae bacterium]
MIKINFVCFGNICRSPMAEFVMKNLVRNAGVEKNFLIESSGCHPSVGTPIHPDSCNELKKNNVHFTKRTSKLFTKETYKNFDYVICMDSDNVYDAKKISGGDPDRKIYLLLEFAGEKRDVDDPYYTDNYAVAYADILHGCQALLEKLSRTFHKIF